MAFVHGKNTVVKVATKDLSAYTDSSELNQSGDSHDVTTYAAATTGGGHVYEGGLTDGKFTFSGTYDSTAVTGPRAVLKPLLRTTVAVIRQPEGTGTGKAQDSFSGVLTGYVETNAVADMVKWSAEVTISGAVDGTPQ